MAYGVLGQAIMHCATLVEAQKFVIKHLWMLHPTSSNPAQLEFMTDVVQVRYLDPPFWPELPNFFIDLFFGAELKRARDPSALTAADFTGFADVVPVEDPVDDTPETPDAPVDTPEDTNDGDSLQGCLLYTSPSPRDATLSRMPSSA